jgi:predicted DCC family thiol-disulfide oxidoreductase YuxK
VNTLKPARTPTPLIVLYDGACPLCSWEIGLYQGLQPVKADEPVSYLDVNAPGLTLPPGTTREQLLARFHVRDREGALLSGAIAFLALWGALPGWRWLAMAARVPGAVWLMELAYRRFLHCRPTLQRWARRLEPRSGPLLVDCATNPSIKSPAPVAPPKGSNSP